MSAPTLSILLIDDDLGDRELVRRSLRESGLEYRLVEADAFSNAVKRHSDTAFDFILIDNSLPDGNGVDLIDDARKVWATAAVALVTGLGSEELAAGAIKNGAVDYISKRNIDGRFIARVIRNGIEVTQLKLQIQSQTEALQRFARVLAHDLRSPLQAVRMLAETMVEGVDGSNQTDIRENAELMLRYSDRLTALIASLEQYNRLNHTPRFEPASADALLDHALENLDVEVKASEVRVERAKLPAISCQPSEITRLFQNLVSNAIKYRNSASPVIRIWSESNADAGRCTFTVADNGLGIPASERETVFEEFRRLHPRSKIDGTGLGLAMCRRIVRRHGGSIWCEPADGGGTLFKFDLPLATAKPHQVRDPVPGLVRQ